ncbi:hypothetical protein FSB78_15115 [Sphingomonas ginsenosidivorax]|uniref:Uncharacterized protein n=1 Tax=Sphingomonas ginsenosidivorax TaxID=862135 RepID=A0A5C6UIR4_9SPHN|nr:hypothetical protein [Sphingomonas ginsenosidivorax]TXC72126.1 hypothetical protein FSB78_15115 [Sphingomonas ginsenosidivorax]
MRNLQLEAELAAHSEHRAPPLIWWRSLAASVFIAERCIVEAAVASVVTASRLAPPDLIGDMFSAQAEEKTDVYNRLAAHFTCLDGMNLGVLWEVAGSCSALAAADYDPVGLLRTLKGLSEPYITAQPEMRLSVAATWLSEMGGILNPTVMSRIDWEHALGGKRRDDDGSIWEEPE